MEHAAGQGTQPAPRCGNRDAAPRSPLPASPVQRCRACPASPPARPARPEGKPGTKMKPGHLTASKVRGKPRSRSLVGSIPELPGRATPQGPSLHLGASWSAATGTAEQSTSRRLPKSNLKLASSPSPCWPHLLLHSGSLLHTLAGSGTPGLRLLLQASSTLLLALLLACRKCDEPVRKTILVDTDTRSVLECAAKVQLRPNRGRSCVGLGLWGLAKPPFHLSSLHA